MKRADRKLGNNCDESSEFDRGETVLRRRDHRSVVAGCIRLRVPLFRGRYLAGVLAQCCIPFSMNNPRLMSLILTIPTSVPLSTTGMRRKFLRPMYEAASRIGS